MTNYVIVSIHTYIKAKNLVIQYEDKLPDSRMVSGYSLIVKRCSPKKYLYPASQESKRLMTIWPYSFFIRRSMRSRFTRSSSIGKRNRTNCPTDRRSIRNQTGDRHPGCLCMALAVVFAQVHGSRLPRPH